MYRSLWGALFVISCASRAQPAKTRAPEVPAFEAEDIRNAERAVIAALESSDPTAWVYLYTEDAVLAESDEIVEGRPALLEMARAMKPLTSVAIAPRHTEGDGRLAYVRGHASWVGAQGPTKVRALMIWRKEPDGIWRIAYESLIPEK